MRFAFTFPGQGSQSVGMMAGYGEVAVVRDTFAQAADVLGIDLWRLVTHGPADELNQTVNTQPAMLAAGVAVYRLWRDLGGPVPDVMAGHSLGEYSALVCAEALSFVDAVRLVRLRAEAMQAAVPEGAGAMAAILGLNDDVVRVLCAQAAAGEVLEAVNFNAPGQVVIAGAKPAVERACALAKGLGAKRALPLPVSVPSHCALMRPAAARLAEALAATELHPPAVAVLHNADVAGHATPAAIRDALVRQLHSPVRWVESVCTIADRGVGLIAECGPGKVLVGLNKRIVDTPACIALSDAAVLKDTIDRINQDQDYG